MKNRALQKLMGQETQRYNKFFTGELIRETYLFENRWVCDIVLSQDTFVLYKVPIADYNLNISSFRKNTPVLLEKKGMSFWVVGKSDYKKEPITKTFYELPSNIQKMKGIVEGEGGIHYTSIGNVVVIPPTTSKRYSVTIRKWSYGELTPYGEFEYGKSSVEYLEV
jgi:hypothetical protein